MNPVSRRRTLALCALPIAAWLLPAAARAQPYDLDVPPPPALPQAAIDALLAAASSAGGIVDGHSAHRLYVFYDPNCPYCHRLYDDLRADVARGAVQVSWITVGFLAPSSLPKAAAILQARNPLAALRRSERDYAAPGEGHGGGGIAPAPTVEPATRARLRHNLDMLRAVHALGVPALVWRGRDGEARMLLGAVAPDRLRELVSLLA
jgi:thiol:disulfide interchange protein DsbG